MHTAHLSTIQLVNPIKTVQRCSVGVGCFCSALLGPFGGRYCWPLSISVRLKDNACSVNAYMFHVANQTILQNLNKRLHLNNEWIFSYVRVVGDNLELNVLWLVFDQLWTGFRFFTLSCLGRCLPWSCSLGGIRSTFPPLCHCVTVV